MLMKSKVERSLDPKISVLVPTFNRAHFLGQCLDSILAQTLPACQIIVVNNGSEDQTRQICESYKDSIEYHEINQLGKSGAINYGLDHVRGDYIWIFDDDDIALPDALKRFVGPLEGNPEYGFSFSSYFITENNKTTNQIGPVIEELIIPDFTKWGFLIPLLEWNFLGGAALFARTSTYKMVGKLDPKLLRSQDYELAIRIARNFTGVRVSGGATFYYRQHDGNRGALSDCFEVQKRPQKWLEYDQVFFRKLYQDLPLIDYIPSRNNLKGRIRQAILQRICIMLRKRLYPEMIKDLEILVQLDNSNPFSREEYLIIREKLVANPPCHDQGSIFDCVQFFDTVCRLSKFSLALRILQNKIFRTTLGQYSSHWPRLDQIPVIVRCLFHLYFSTI